jgi:hypothetical protein
MNIVKVAQALRALADAVEEPNGVVGHDLPAEQPAKTKPAKAKVTEETRVEEPVAETTKEPSHDTDDTPPFGTQDDDVIDLETLQEHGAAMIRAGKRETLVKALKRYKLANLSSCPPELYKALWNTLTKEAA